MVKGIYNLALYLVIIVVINSQSFLEEVKLPGMLLGLAFLGIQASITFHYLTRDKQDKD